MRTETKTTVFTTYFCEVCDKGFSLEDICFKHELMEHSSKHKQIIDPDGHSIDIYYIENDKDAEFLGFDLSYYDYYHQDIKPGWYYFKVGDFDSDVPDSFICIKELIEETRREKKELEEFINRLEDVLTSKEVK
jgi:hypothetical protein